MKKTLCVMLFLLFSMGWTSASLSTIDTPSEDEAYQSLCDFEDSFIQRNHSGSADTVLSVSHLNICGISSINSQAKLSVSFDTPLWRESNFCDRVFGSEMNFEFKGAEDVLMNTGLFNDYSGPKASYLYMPGGISYVPGQLN